MVFKVYDIDKNGQISVDEINNVIQAMYDFLGDNIDCKMSPEIIISKVMEKLGLLLIFIYTKKILNILKIKILIMMEVYRVMSLFKVA